MIPPDRPVTGRDLGNLRIKLGLSTDDMAFLCGLPKNRYHKMVNQEADEPLASIPTAIMVRLLDTDESLNFMPEFPSPQELYETLEPYGVTRNTFSVLLGNHSTSMQRWERSKRRAVPAVYRLALVIQNLCRTRGTSKGIKHLESIVAAEGALRGVQNVLESGRWNPEPPQRRGSTKAKAEDK